MPVSKNVIISVKGNQTGSDQDTNSLELVTEGKYYKKGGNYFVTYRESEVTGLEGTTTTLKISDGMVMLMRFGTVNSQLVFVKGQKHVSYYDTAQGAFTIGVFTNQVNVDVDDSGGEIWVDYNLEIDNNKFGSNDFYMHIREAGSANDKQCGECDAGN